MAHSQRKRWNGAQEVTTGECRQGRHAPGMGRRLGGVGARRVALDRERASNALLNPRALPTLPEEEREQARVAIEKESHRLRSLTYPEIILDKHEGCAPAIHPRGLEWGTDWSERVSKALKTGPSATATS